MAEQTKLDSGNIDRPKEIDDQELDAASGGSLQAGAAKIEADAAAIEAGQAAAQNKANTAMQSAWSGLIGGTSATGKGK